MKFELISQILLIFSGLGLLFLTFRKIPVLTELPELAGEGFNFKKFLLDTNRRIKTLPIFRNFSYEIVLQKILAKFRILTMKAENKTFSLIQQLKERTQKKIKQGDNYWEKIKKMKDKNLPT